MNIVGHIIIGVAGYVITKEPLFLIGSIIPDVTLIFNELRFKKFDKWNVKFKILYDISHSIYIPILLFLYNDIFAIAYFIHLLIDIPFHTSSFRWKPFLINRYNTKKKVLLLSGGADSIACAELEKDYDCIFFDYGQFYSKLEFDCAVKYCEKKNIKLIIKKRKWHTDIKNRNFYLISECIKLGYDEVIIGTRNVFPFFDKYKDSNWLSLKLFQFLTRTYINMPLIGNFKFQVIKKTNGNKFYSTEF
jgi:hypothetical protein